MVSGKIGLAVSQLSDPLGSYFIYHIRLTSDDLSGCGVDCFPDYPHGGYDANALSISARLIHCPTCFVASAVYVLSKAQLEAGLNIGESPDLARFLIPDDFVVQPGVPAPHEPFEAANGGTEHLLGAPFERCCAGLCDTQYERDKPFAQQLAANQRRCSDATICKVGGAVYPTQHCRAHLRIP
jgi:hypothetical protein